MIANSEQTGRFANYLEPPLPLISENKFSMQPDLAHGWKPDAQSLTKIPSLTHFKSPQEMFESRFKDKQKSNSKKAAKEKISERESILAKMLATDGSKIERDDIARVLQDEHTEQSDTESQITAQNKTFPKKPVANDDKKFKQAL